ncbi:hypothetical protein OAH36_02565 [Verrucomicrobia bacterium]|nr:hypothetical protein [Verrucomicrobiota bacterium]
MRYPKTNLPITSSSKRIREYYLHAQLYTRNGPYHDFADVTPDGWKWNLAVVNKEAVPRFQHSDPMFMAIIEDPEGFENELECLIDPVKRVVYDRKLGLDERNIRIYFEWESDEWGTLLRVFIGLLAFMVFGLSDNVTRFYGYFLAPDFVHSLPVSLLTPEPPGGYREIFGSSDPTWQTILNKRVGFLVLPTVIALIVLTIKGVPLLRSFIARRIARKRFRGEYDSSVRTFWSIFPLATVALCYLILYLFGPLGPERIVPITRY